MLQDECAVINLIVVTSECTTQSDKCQDPVLEFRQSVGLWHRSMRSDAWILAAAQMGISGEGKR
jgi:hypothetical protein